MSQSSAKRRIWLKNGIFVNSTARGFFFSASSVIIKTTKGGNPLDQIKTEKFIAAMRKEQKLTQRQLADILGISDKTVSKWECGNGMPEVSLMLPLCESLKINVNELLSGEKLTDDNYHQKAEENMINLIREKEESKKKIILSVIISMLCICVTVVLVLLAGLTPGFSTTVRILLIVFGALVTVIGIGVAVVLDSEAGAYECPKCHSRFVPTKKAYIMGPHTLTRRKLKCPHCGESSFCKRRLTK